MEGESAAKGRVRPAICALVFALVVGALTGAAGDAADLRLLAESVPGITGVAPASGPTGTSLTLTGSGLSGVTQVKVNGLTATFSVVSDSEVAAIVPNGATTGTVTAVTPEWTATSGNPFAVTLSVNALAPSSGAPGDLVRISGVGFDGVTSVKFKGTPASFAVLTPSALTAYVPQGAKSGPITVTTSVGSASSAKFKVLAGPPPPPPPSTATLLLNEVAPKISGGADLIELIVTVAGSTQNMTVKQNPTGAPVVLATLPNITVVVGDLVVVHLNPGAGITNETTSKAACTDPACYALAWDVAGGTTGITHTNAVLSVHSSAGAMLEAVPFAQPSLPIPPTGFPAELQAIQAAGLWLPANCGGSPCTYTSTPTAQSISVDWTAVGITPTGNTVARAPGLETNSKNDWTLGPHSFGSQNP